VFFQVASVHTDQRLAQPAPLRGRVVVGVDDPPDYLLILAPAAERLSKDQKACLELGQKESFCISALVAAVFQSLLINFAFAAASVAVLGLICLEILF